MVTGELEPLDSQCLRCVRCQEAGKPCNAQARNPQTPPPAGGDADEHQKGVPVQRADDSDQITDAQEITEWIQHPQNRRVGQRRSGAGVKAWSTREPEWVAWSHQITGHTVQPLR